VKNVWKNRPSLPEYPVFEHDVKFAGKTRAEKLSQVRTSMHQKGVDFHLLCSLDDIAWTLNLRGKDVMFNPVFVSYLLIGLDEAFLFIQPEKVDAEITNKLVSDNIHILAYNEMGSLLPGIISGKKVLMQTAKSNEWLAALVRDNSTLIDDQNIPILFKSMKNQVEIEHTRRVMEKDGVALLRFFRWLEAEIHSGGLNEYTCGEKIAFFRSQMPGYVGESFAPIVGYAGHGAIVHYSANPENAYTLKPEGILLVDSGGQYHDGTTDITRTITLGKPTEEQKKHFTLVLKGHIRVAMAKFPYGTRGFHLDTLARLDLWENQLNYGHGTGHGVGFFLNVHEGPQGISPNPVVNQVFEQGMITSNEPGLYIEDQYGIRIENLILSKELPGQGTGRYLEFETLSLFPIDLQLIERRSNRYF
jgi:Xaa-Pro aminopeptidase